MPVSFPLYASFPLWPAKFLIKNLVVYTPISLILTRLDVNTSQSLEFFVALYNLVVYESKGYHMSVLIAFAWLWVESATNLCRDFHLPIICVGFYFVLAMFLQRFARASFLASRSYSGAYLGPNVYLNGRL